MGSPGDGRDPWMTSFVDCTPGQPGPLLGLAPGRTGGCVREWLSEQSDAFRRQIEIVVIDPSAPYASGIRAALPGVKIAVDKWHLVALANTMVTEVRQRVTRDLLGRRGTVADPIWVNRRLLLTGAEHLSSKQWNRLWRSFDTCDPTKEVQAAWAVKERLRLLLREREPSKIRWRLADFYEAAIDAHLPEATRLAGTVQTWWPAILTALLDRRRQRPNRRVQPDHQTSQKNRLRLPQHDQLPAAYPHPHRGHPTAKISSMNGPHPAQVRRAGKTPVPQ